jgi:hypothetical protein
LGQTSAEVSLDRPGSLRIASYTCFEQGSRVVGLIAGKPEYNFEPMFDIAANGEPISQLTGMDYIKGLESVGAHDLRPVPNCPWDRCRCCSTPSPRSTRTYPQRTGIG